MDVFGRNVSEVLESRKMSQAALSRATGIPASAMSRYLTGESEIPASRAKAIASALGVTMDSLYGLSPIPDPRIDELLKCWETMSEDGRFVLLTTARSLSQVSAQEGDSDKRVEGAA